MINILPPEVFNQIAAGEVVDRPYSVVKELIENAVDAGATKIIVEAEEGGRSICVTDNGAGIPKEELFKAFLPHATSKLKTAEDLARIATLGFRGEAVASIASVSRMKIISKKRGEDCYSLSSEGGKLGELCPEAGADGTCVRVCDLFFNTPARLKFLKSDISEEADITNIVLRCALLRPDIAFTLYLNGKQRLKTYGDGLKSVIAILYGAEALENCYLLDAEKNGVKIKGYLGGANYYKPNRTYQSLFVNGRYVINQTVSLAIANAFSRYLMKRQYPFYVLFMELPPLGVDVNVHPNKADVRFSDNHTVYSAVYSVVSSVLDGSSRALSFVAELPQEKRKEEPQERAEEEDEGPKFVVSKEDIGKDLYGPRTRGNGNLILFSSAPKREERVEEREEKEARKEDFFEENQKFLREAEEKKMRQDKIDPKLLTYKGELFQTYLIYEVGDVAYFVDQHAAHEKTLFCALKERTDSLKPLSQPMLVPYILHVNAQEYDFLKKNISQFLQLGFEMEEFGGASFKISAHPSELVGMDMKAFFDDVLSSLETLKGIKLSEIFRDRIAGMACKAAVKGGEKLTEQEVRALIEEMEGDMGLKCPHGRPACVKMKKAEFEKLFKRIV